jgi:hypothetical protein
VFLRAFCGFLPFARMAWRARVISREQLRHLPHFAVMSVLATTLYYRGFVAGTALLPISVAGLSSGSVAVIIGAAIGEKITGMELLALALILGGVIDREAQYPGRYRRADAAKEAVQWIRT